MEEAEADSANKAHRLIAEMSSHFLRITYTLHPVGIAGEARGKSSNIAWAARVLMQTAAERPSTEDTIVTVMDGKHLHIRDDCHLRSCPSR